MEITINTKLYIIREELQQREKHSFQDSIKNLSDEDLKQLEKALYNRINKPFKTTK